MITVVGSLKGIFPFMAPNKQPYYHETDSNNYYYGEMCGHRWMLDRFIDLQREPYLGLEHYRRAFDLTDAQIKDILEEYDVIVKEEHGPYGDETNLSVLAGCSRHHINYLGLAKKWIEQFPELKEQADYNKHWGCNMLIAKPEKYKEIMDDEFRIINELLKTTGLTQSSIGYFCETILTPAMIRKHCKQIYVAPVRFYEKKNQKPYCVLGVLKTKEGLAIKSEMMQWLTKTYNVITVEQDSPGELFEHPAITTAASLSVALNQPVLYLHTKGAANINQVQPVVRKMWQNEFSDPYKYLVIATGPRPVIVAPEVSTDKCTWFNGFVLNPEAGKILEQHLHEIRSDRFYYESVARGTDIDVVSPYHNVEGHSIFELLDKLSKGEKF